MGKFKKLRICFNLFNKEETLISMDYASDQEIILDFIDEEKLLESKSEKRISVQTLRDESQINFHQLLQHDWQQPPNPQHPSLPKSATIHQLTIPEQKQQHLSSKGIQTHIMEQEKPPIANNPGSVQMRGIFTIFESPEAVEDIELYLSSEIFHWFIKIVVMINFIGLLITDYSFRLDQVHGNKTILSVDNAVSLNFELFSNCVFTVQIILYFFSSRPVFSNYWVMLNIIGTIACWATIFFDPIESDAFKLFEIIHILRIIRGFRIIQVFDCLKDLFETFLGTLPDLGKIFYPLLIFVTFLTIVGQQLYIGANEYKCRATPLPVGQSWPAVDSTNMCGASLRKCPLNSYCGNPYDYGLPLDQMQFMKSSSYNSVKFDDFFSSLLVTYHYVFMTNFTPTIFRFARYINPMLTTFYFVGNAVILFYILANLVFVGLSKAYLEKEKLLQKQKENDQNQNDESIKGQSQDQQQFSDKQKLVIKIIQIFEILIILVQSVVILIDYWGMPQDTKDDLSIIDFVITIIAIFVVIIHVFILRMRFLKSVHHIVDVIMIVFFVADVIYCLSNGYSVVYMQEETSEALRAIKIVRILKILYVSESFFKYERNIVNIFFGTLKKMRYFLLMLSCIGLIFSFIGKILFSYRVRYALDGSVNVKDGLPYVTHFDSSYKSVISIVTLFENQRWSDALYKYYQSSGLWGAIFFVVIVFFSHLLLTRLFMAVFFCNFRQDLQETMGLGNEKPEQQNDELKSQNHKNNQKTIIHQHNEAKSMEQDFEYSSSTSNQTSQNFKKHKMEQILKDEKLFWFVDRNSYIVQFLKFIHESKTFYYLVLLGIAAQALTIVLRSNVDSEEKTFVLDTIENVAIAIYCLQFVVGVASNGFYFCHHSYLKQNNFNKVNLFVIICLIVSNFTFIDKLYRLMIRRLIIVKVITILKTRNKEMDIILKCIAKISTNFLRVLFIYFLFILMTSVIPLKLLKGTMYNCNNYYSFKGMTLKQTRNPIDCMNAGGDWKEDSQNFNNIFNSVILMYQIVTSQSWTYFFEVQVFKDTHWDIYFVVNFFFYNTCLLNIFVGLIVETYVYLKDKAYKLDLLKPSQKGWILIKNCINELVPTPTIGSLKIKGFVQQVTFQIVTHQYYNNFIDFLAYLNIILYAMTIYRSSAEYTAILLYFRIAIMIIFCLDTLLKVYALRKEYFYLENSKVQLMGFIYIIFYGFINAAPLTNEEVRIINFFLAIFLLLRAKKFLFRFTWSKTLINSVIEILPKCIQIGSFLFIILFIYVAIGLQVLKHVKPSSVSDNYTTGFNNFYTGLMTLIKLASNESWFDQVTTFVRGSQSSDICYNIHGEQDAIHHNGMGCGTYLAVPFLLSYHIIMSLFILNLLIATMVSAYDQNYEKQYNSVNVFQLQDCLQLWKKYDPRGTGVIAYKKFWKLSSQIGILFGISKKKLIKSKQKFLQELNIPICQSINPEDSSVLCYRFHDVITKFSKIKLQVSADKGDENSNSIEFDIHPMIENQIKDFIVNVPQELYRNYRQYKNYTSGEMKYIFGLLRKMRSWKTHSKSKGQVKVSKLTQIIKTAISKKVQEENLKNILAFVNERQTEFEKRRRNTNQSIKKNSSPQKSKNVLIHDQSDESYQEIADQQNARKGKHNKEKQKRFVDFDPNQKVHDGLFK